MQEFDPTTQTLKDTPEPDGGPAIGGTPPPDGGGQLPPEATAAGRAALSEGQQEGGEQEKAKRTRQPNPDAGHYVVMAAIQRDPTEEGGDAPSLAFSPVGKYKADGQDEAKKTCLAEQEALRDAVQNGHRLWLAAVPASSWKPEPVEYKAPDPLAGFRL